MALFGNPNGSSFYMGDPAREIMFDSLALNVLRSLQFSYMLMKGFRSTTRALKDLDIFRDEDIGAGRGESFRWRPAGSTGDGRVGGIGTPCSSSSNIYKTGRCSVGRCYRGGTRIGKAGSGRRLKCTRDNFDNTAPGERNSQGKMGPNGPVADTGKVSKGTGRMTGKSGDLNIAGNPIKAPITEGTKAGLVPEGSGASGMACAESRVPTDSVVESTFRNGMTNRALSVTGLGAVFGISNQLKPMKGFMNSVKMATGVVSGVKTATGVIQKFQAPAGGVLIGFGAANGVVLGFETARMIVKGAKISKDFAKVWKFTRTRIGIQKAVDLNAAGATAGRETFLKGLKASDGVLTLVKLTKEFGSGLGGSLQDGLTNWDLVSKSYDASNGMLKVVEGVLGLKGGGMIGVVGKGFTALKGAVSGLGLSVKLVKGIGLSKEISILLLKGFGISKTIMQAFKATQDGKKMLRWLMFRDGSKVPVGEHLLQTRRTALLKGRADARMCELLTCLQPSAVGSQDISPSLLYSLASLLQARCDASEVGDPVEDWFPWSNGYKTGLRLADSELIIGGKSDADLPPRTVTYNSILNRYSFSNGSSWQLSEGYLSHIQPLTMLE